MSTRSKRTKSTAPGTSSCTERISGWERSRVSTTDLRKLKKMDLLTNGELTRIPGDEAVPNPPEGFRRNNSGSAIYNVGGVCIYVRPDIGYFDLKFADSVQGWRKKWLYIKDEPNGAQLYGLSPVDLSQEILRRKSWDAKATPEEIAATDSLVFRIKALQNTPGQELFGVQILAYFLWVRVQPLQARATPLWMYSGAGDSARISADLPVGELEKLPTVKEMIELGTRFTGYCIEAETLRGGLLRVQEHNRDLEQRLEASDKARRDAEAKIEAAKAKAATADDLRVRLNDVEAALSKKEEQISRRESAVVARLETQSNRFLKKIGEMYTQNQGTDEDALLDALSVLEMNCSLARDCLKYGRAALERIFPHLFLKAAVPEKFEPLAKSFLEKEDPMLAHRHASLKIGVEGTIALVMASGEKVD
ncbi:hypothetical protein QYE76_019671 [Lolium multiflorum]|uniref:Uncharacterized protein n=1 Tax=Lolium multiflorum TaxID=4521 RepID=A0AAD8R664_LOLMU|nr:hypothetical protein QYE76_019671 [Lolium multiflorum]